MELHFVIDVAVGFFTLVIRSRPTNDDNITLILNIQRVAQGDGGVVIEKDVRMGWDTGMVVSNQVC